MNNNLPLSVDTGRGLSINYLGKNLYSKYNPSSTPVKIVESLDFHDETLYIVPSPLLLYGINEILEKLPDSSYLLGIEIDQNLMHETDKINNPIIHCNFKTYRLDSREQLKLAIENLGIWKFRKCHLIPLNSGYNLYREKYDLLFEFAQTVLSTFWRNRLTINKLGKLWVKNIFNNSLLINSAKPSNEGKPVVVCGAGASLEESISILNKYREHIYIIAVDTALSSLLESDIKPDLVFALEAQFYNLGDFYNSIDQNINLLTDITGYPAVCRKLSGDVYFYATDFFQNKLLDRIDGQLKPALKIPPLGSVGVAAVYSALRLFQTPVFLTGLDFSFVPGKSHSRGTPFSNSQLRNSNRFLPAGSYNMAMNRTLLKKEGKTKGSVVQTDSILETYAKLLKDLISDEKRVYDLSKSGYSIGAEYADENMFREIILHIDTEKSYSPPKESICQGSLSFLRQEQRLLEGLVREWERFNSTETDEIPDDLMSALKLVDYSYLDFPDRLPHPKKEISFISRAVTSARDYLKIIDRLINE